MTAETQLPLHRNRDYRLLWLAHALSGFGSQLSTLALPLVVLQATGSVAAFGIVTFAGISTSVLTSLFAGIMVDRLPRKPLMVTSDIARALAYFALTAAVLTDRLTLLIAVAVAVFNSVCGAPFAPAATAALRHVVPKQQLGTALSLSQGRSAAITLAGPLLGAALYTIAPALPFLIDALSYLLSTACLLGVRLPPHAPHRDDAPPPPRILKDLTTGLTEVRRSSFLRYTLVNAAVVNFAISGIVLVLITDGAKNASSYHNGLIIATSGAGNLIGSLLATRANKTFAPRTLVLAVCWSTAIFTPLLALQAGLAATVVLIGLCSLATPAANAVIAAARLHTIPDHLQGRVQTACSLPPALIVPFAPLISGALLTTLPDGTVMLLNSALLIGLAIYSTKSTGLQRIPDLRKPNDTPTPPRDKPTPHPPTTTPTPASSATQATTPKPIRA